MNTPEYRIQQALDVIERYGGFEGAHHKAWVLDQVVRELTGDGNEYRKWVRKVKAGEDGPNTYEHDEGIPP